jgi:putative transposase
MRSRRGPQVRAGDVALAGAIRSLVDVRPTYGYRRIAALLKRERRSDDLPPVNTKRVYRLMKSKRRSQATAGSWGVAGYA